MLLSIDEIASYTGGAVIAPGLPGAMASGVTWDSREVKAGDLYVALPGARVDGHDYCAAAAEAGATCALVSHGLPAAAMERAAAAGCAVVRVDDTARALADLAGGWRGHLSGPVIAITGSNGKTTTKNLVRDVLSAGMEVVATKANQNNELGVPRTLLAADEETDAIVVEMGMRGMGQLAALCDYVRPDMGLVTNVGTSHIELLGSRENIALAKGELYDALPAGGVAFVNADDDYAEMLMDELELDDRGVRTVFFAGTGTFRHAAALAIWRDAHPFVWAEDVEYDDAGRPTFTVRARHFAEMGLPDADADARCTLQLAGAHNVSNACAATAVGLAFGLSLERCCAALAQARPESGRQEARRNAAGVLVIDDAYNANPDSTCASLETFAKMRVSGRRIAVIGDMLELGDYAAEGHARVGRVAAQAGVDLLVCVGELARGIADAARAAGMPESAVATAPDAAAAARIAADEAAPGDAVLVKASHSMGLDRVVEELMA